MSAFESVNNFLNVNVFSNFSNIINRNTLRFENVSSSLTNSNKIGFKAAFAKLWVPTINDLDRRFKDFEKNFIF